MGSAVSRAAPVKRSGRRAVKRRAAGRGLWARPLHLHQHGLVSAVARRGAGRLSDAREHDQLSAFNVAGVLVASPPEMRKASGFPIDSEALFDNDTESSAIGKAKP